MVEAPCLASGLCNWADGMTVTGGRAHLGKLKACVQGCCLQLSAVQQLCKGHPADECGGPGLLVQGF